MHIKLANAKFYFSMKENEVIPGCHLIGSQVKITRHRDLTIINNFYFNRFSISD